MKVAIMMDSFKGNLTSMEAAAFVSEGVLRVFPEAEIHTLPVADGGEGTVDALTIPLGGRKELATVRDPLGREISAPFGVLPNGDAVLEMAAASGIGLLKPEEYAPLLTSSYGTGQLLAAALEKGCQRIFIGIGGSATNDGGAGMARALGVRFLDASGQELPEGGAALAQLHHIDISGLHPGLAKAEIIVACDVDNPLCGSEGASLVYGKQKGASLEEQVLLDSCLAHYADVLERDLAVSLRDQPGSGAAGGLGAGLLAFCGARLERGIDMVMDVIGAEQEFEWADIVITGEGRIDGQTVHGKVPSGVTTRAKKYEKPVFAIAGFAERDSVKVYTCGLDAVVSSMQGSMELDEAMQEAPMLIADAAERLFRVIRCFWRKN